MAKASWLNVTPASGSGDATVSVSSTAEHTGRNARSTTLTWTAANVADVVRNVSQAGKPEYVDIAESASSDKSGKTSSYTANSVSTSNGAAISGDPGASAEYNFSISIVVPANGETFAQTRQIIVEAADGKRDTCTLTLAAGDAYITIAAGTIELDYKGTAVSVAVQSNTDWTIK